MADIVEPEAHCPPQFGQATLDFPLFEQTGRACGRFDALVIGGLGELGLAAAALKHPNLHAFDHRIGGDAERAFDTLVKAEIELESPAVLVVFGGQGHHHFIVLLKNFYSFGI